MDNLKEILIDISTKFDIDIDELFKLYLNNKNNKEKYEEEKENNIEIVFTVGASNQKTKASYGIFFKEGDKRNIGKELLIENPTNNKGELYGILAALKVSNIKKELIIYTDSTYCINSLTKWHKKWIKNGWKTTNGKDVLNQDLIKEILKILENRNVKFRHVKAHKSPPKNKTSEEYKIWYGNKMADKYAYDIIH